MENDEDEIRTLEIQSNEMTKPILRNISDSDLSSAVEFFLIFSRFEYALKQAGFIVSNGYDSAKPDWKEFSFKVGSEFNNREKRYKELEEAINYLNAKPPQIQKVKSLPNGNKELCWKDVEPKESEAESLTDSIKRIRNNLFHGGKIPFDPNRDSKLIKSAAIILKYFLESNAASSVRRYYN